VEFSLFMGPRLLSFTRGETRYSLKLIPIGGSCLMEGEESSSEDSRALNRKPKWVQAVIYAAGSFMNLATAFILVLILNISMGYSTCVLSAVAENSPAATAPEPLKAGDTLVSYGGKRVHVPSDVFIYLQDTKGAAVDVTFKRGGALMGTVLTPSYTPGKRYILGFNGAQSDGPDWNLIQLVSEGEPADILGLRPGDRLLTVAGQTPASREELREIFEATGGGEVDVTWQRQDGSYASGRIAPAHVDGQDNYSIGVYYEAASGAGVLDSLRYAYYNSLSYSKMVIYSLKWMITGTIGVDQVSGPVGIVAEIGAGLDETRGSPYGLQISIIYLMNLTALIGINLGLFNLIPFPPLDGSKLLILGIEAVRRKDIPIEKQMAISMFGFAVLILIMVLTLFNDIFKLVGR